MHGICYFEGNISVEYERLKGDISKVSKMRLIEQNKFTYDFTHRIHL